MYTLIYICRSLYVYIKERRVPLPRRHVRHDPPDKWQYVGLFMCILIYIYRSLYVYITVRCTTYISTSHVAHRVHRCLSWHCKVKLQYTSLFMCILIYICISLDVHIKVRCIPLS